MTEQNRYLHCNFVFSFQILEKIFIIFGEICRFFSFFGDDFSFFGKFVMGKFSIFLRDVFYGFMEKKFI